MQLLPQSLWPNLSVSRLLPLRAWLWLTPVDHRIFRAKRHLCVVIAALTALAERLAAPAACKLAPAMPAAGMGLGR
jgi:hypothetical protein